MLLILLVCSLTLAASGQQDDDWIDPYDMLNYDASTKTMRNPGEQVNYQNVPTKRREYTQDSNQDELTSCKDEVEGLKRQIEDQKKKITQPSCNPVFKRFLSRLLKEIQRVGVPSDSRDVLYDAKVQLSKQAMAEIQSLLEGEESWRTGALDSAISQILVDLKPHDYEVWRWRFEDTFGVELDMLLKMMLFVLIITMIVCTQLWSTVSWFVQFRRLFTLCFLVSVVWNWFYLYKIAFADHQNNVVKMDSVNEKCTGMKRIDWTDNLKEWFRSTWTLQDDPCKRYYEVLMVNPILLVPPTKAISVTITTFITEPLKHFGQGISDFLRALLKDLPVTLQIPVLLTIVLSILVFMYGGVQAIFRYGITAPLQTRRDPPPPELDQQRPTLRRIEDRDHRAGGDAPQQALRHRAVEGRIQRNQFRQRRTNRERKEPANVIVETLRTADPSYSEDEIDAERREESTDSEQSSDPQIESDSENQQDAQEQRAGAKVANKEAKADKSESKTKRRDSSEASRNGAAARSQPAETRPAQTAAGGDAECYICTEGTVNIHMRHKLNPDASAEDRTTTLTHLETSGVPVQETSPSSAV